MRLRKALAWALLALSLPAAAVIWSVRIDNRLERWVVQDDEQARVYEEFKHTFGSDEFVVVGLSGESLFDFAVLDTMVEVVDEIETVPGVRRVRGMPLVYRDLLGAEDPEELREEMTSTPFYRGLFISPDATAVGLMVEVDPPALSMGRAELMHRLRSAVAPLAELGLDPALVGSPALIVALDEVSVKESRRSFAVALLCSLLVLAVLFRSLRAMVVAAVCSALTVVFTLALMVVSGRSLNMITSVLPALLWVLALSGAIYVIRRYQHHRKGESIADAVGRSLDDVTRPCALSAVTTALGFASLVAAAMTPVRELGFFASLGILISLAVNLSVAPAMLSWLRVPSRFVNQRAGLRSGLALTRPRLIVTAGVAVVALTVALVPGLRVASNPLSFLPEGHSTTRDYDRVGSRLTGFYTMEVVLSMPGAWTDPMVWPVLDRLAETIGGSPMVARVLTPLDILRKLNHWNHELEPEAYRLPDSRSSADSLLVDLDAAGRDTLRSLVAPSATEVRLSAIVNEMDESRFLELVTATRQELERLPEGFAGQITGQVLQLVNAQQFLVAGQLRSLGLALLVVFAAIGLGLRSWRLTLLSVLPNLLPIVAAFGLMALLDIPLDAATAMVASVALGIAVDDTVHLLTAIDRENRRRPELPIVERVAAALRRVGPAMVITTITASIGFFALCTSAFVPIRHFGILAGAAMIAALAADLLLVPALLALRADLDASARAGGESRERDLV